MRVIALLRHPDDWHKIYGWADLDEGIVVCDSPVGQFGVALLALFFLAMISLQIDYPSVVALATSYAILGGITLFFAARGITILRAQRRLKRLLLQD